MRAGRLRHKITIQRLTTQDTDDFGTPQDSTWSAVALGTDMPADVIPLMGRLVEEASAIEGRVTHKIRTRFVDGLDITSADRVSYDGRTLGIKAVVHASERRREVVIWVEEATT